MAEDKSFKELIAEQKQTNKLLLQQMASDEKGSKVGTSFKNAAGEIITELAVSRKAKKEADETQAIIKKTSDKALEENEKNQKESNKVWSSIANTLTGAFIGKGGSKGSAAEKESFKDEAARDNALLKKYLGKNSFVGKGIIGIFEGISGFAKSLYGKGKGILGVLLGVAGYGLLLKYINSPEFQEFIKSGDAAKKIAAAAKAISKKIDDLINFFTKDGDDGDSGKPVGFFEGIGLRLKKLSKDMVKAYKGKDGYGFDDAAKENAGTIAGIIATIYSGTILKYGAKLTAFTLTALRVPTLIKRGLKTLLGVGRTTLGYGAGLARTAKGLAKGTGILGVMFGLYEGVQFMFSEKAATQRGEGTGSYLSNLIGGAVGGIYNSAAGVIAMVLGFFGEKELKDEMEKTDWRAEFSKLYNDFGKFLVDTFVYNPIAFLRKSLFGLNENDIKNEIEELEEKKKIMVEDNKDGISVYKDGKTFTIPVEQSGAYLALEAKIAANERILQGGELEGGIVQGMLPKYDKNAMFASQLEAGTVGVRNKEGLEARTKYLELKEKGIPARLFYNEQDKLTVESGVAPVVPVVTTNQTNYNNSTFLNSTNIANMSMNEIIYGNR